MLEKKNVTGAELKKTDVFRPNLWTYDQPGTGIQSTQQYNVDWENFENHVFFNSAESKVNLAFDRIINGYPFDGTSEEIENYLAGLSGYEKHVLGIFPSHTGSVNFFSGSNQYISLKDRAGYLFLGITKNKKAKSIINKGINTEGFCLETWIALPEHQTEDMFVFQAKNNAYTGLSLFVHSGSSNAANIVALVSSGSTSKTNYSIITGSIPRGQFNHIAINYKRGTTDRLEFYKDGTLISSSSQQAEISGSLRLANQTLYIGTGSSHQYTQTEVLGYGGSGTTFSGSLDEFRLWAKPRSNEEIKEYINRNVFGDENLKLYYRFNEPSTTGLSSVYSAKNITLDYSGNGLHGIFANYSNPVRDITYSNPIKLERLEDNPVLFPDFVNTISLNQRLLLSGTQYDANNPNMIMKLVPDHYFREGKFFEGIENEKGDFIASYEYDSEVMNGDLKYLPGRGKIPHSQILTTFLLIWGAFFDDMKLHIDQMVSLKNARHNYFDTVPLQFMPFLAQYYGIELPNPFRFNNPLEYHKGFNLTPSPQRSQNSLLYVMSHIWNRLLTEMPYILKQKGTIQSVRSLLAAMGIDAESSYRIKEYGGSKTLSLDGKRIRKSGTFNYLDFTAVQFLSSSDVAVYRHEPGYPSGGPLPSATLIDSGDIKIVRTNTPILTQITSASWAYEANYKMLNDENFLTQSLWRLETIDKFSKSNMILNLLAMRNLDEVNKSEKIKLLVSASDQQLIEVNVATPNFWDGSRWYVNLNHQHGPISSSFDLRVKRGSIDNILLEYSGSKQYINLTSSLYSHLDTTKNPNGCHWVIGSSSYGAYNDAYLKANTNDLSSSAVNFLGKVGTMNLWSKALSPTESREHCLNLESVGVDDPRVNYNFTADPFTGNLGVKSDAYAGSLPEGSWERLRTSIHMYSTGTADGDGRLVIQDVSQNNLDVIIKTAPNGTSSIKKTPVLYSSVSPYWDTTSTYNKVRVRSYQSKERAENEGVFHGSLYSLGDAEIGDDKRFGIEASAVQKLNEDMANIFSDMKILNNFIGAPELEYSMNYPDIDVIREKYFRRMTKAVDYNTLFKFFKWFNLNMEPLVASILPKTVNFLGVNFVVESHMLERNKFEYKQGDVHVDIEARKAIEVFPIFIGDVRMEIT